MSALSSAVSEFAFSETNPVTDEAVGEILRTLGVTVPAPDYQVYTSLLRGTWEIWNQVDQMGDYVLEVDEDRFPRENVHRAKSEENASNAWAWKCTIKDSLPNQGLLAGKYVCMKDTIAVKGVPCLLGTDMFSDWVPNMDATVTTRVLEAGGIINGKGVCENLCLWGLSNSAATGPMDNIFAPGYSAGGSSSGTAVCVGLGLSDMGVGGDQGGSIRLPCCVNGLVGLKPTFGLIPYTGIASLEATLDHVGPMTRTVLDNALLLQVLAGVDGIDDRQMAGTPARAVVPDYCSLAKTGVEGLRIGIISESLDVPLHDKRVCDLVVRAAEALTKLGAVVDTVSIPMHRQAPALWSLSGRLSATATLMGQAGGRRGYAMNDLTDKMMPITQEKADKLWPTSISAMVNGLWGAKHLPPSLAGRATNLTRKLLDTYDKALDEFDVLVTPMLAFLPPKMPPPDAPFEDHLERNLGLSMNSSAFNLTGLPALTLPVGRLNTVSGDGAVLPVGMQIVGKMFSEATIFRIAYAWEQANDWKSFA